DRPHHAIAVGDLVALDGVLLEETVDGAGVVFHRLDDVVAQAVEGDLVIVVTLADLDGSPVPGGSETGGGSIARLLCLSVVGPNAVAACLGVLSSATVVFRHGVGISGDLASSGRRRSTHTSDGSIDLGCGVVDAASA